MTAVLAVLAIVFLLVGILAGPGYVVLAALAAFAWPAALIGLDALREWRRRSRR